MAAPSPLLSGVSAADRREPRHGSSAARGLPCSRNAWHQQAWRYSVVGVVSTGIYLLLFLALRAEMTGEEANVLAQVITALGNIAVNRRWTFGVVGRDSFALHQLQGLVGLGAGLVTTAVALALLYVGDPHPDRVTELLVLLAATLVATVGRFLLLRGWIFPAPLAS